MNGFLELLLPWDPSPATLAACVGAVLLYSLGLVRGAAPGVGRSIGFFAGLALMYAVMQTHLDYYAQYLFSAHRGQHLVLHHLAPFLIAWSAPAAVFSKVLVGMPRTRAVLASLRSPSMVRAYRVVQAPWLAGLLFVGLIFFWLIPSVHFNAMLDRRLYWLMNWSMAVDGLLFWWLVFSRPDGATPQLTFGGRLLLLLLIIPPQMLLGAAIALNETPLFDIYDICGRALPMAPLDDQHIGGLITWMPPLMMSLGAVLILLREHLSGQRRDTPAIAHGAAPERRRA